MTTNQGNIIPGCKAMSRDSFWGLIAEVKTACGQDQDKYLDMLKTRLKELGPDHAQDFHDIVQAYEGLAYKYGLWSACELMGSAADDSFNDFNSHLVNLYRMVRERPMELQAALRYVLNSREDFDAIRAELHSAHRQSEYRGLFDTFYTRVHKAAVQHTLPPVPVQCR